MASDPDALTAELAAIREREQKAVRGPWEVVRDEYDDEESPESFPAALRLPEPQRYQLADGSLNEVRPESYEYSDFAELPPGTVEWIAAARTDLPRLLAAVEAAQRIAAGWLADAPEVPVLDREVAGNVIQQILTRELLSKENGHD